MARDNPTPLAPLMLATETACKVVERRATLTILTHLALEAKGKTLKVSGTDLDTEITVSIPWSGAAFSAAAPGETLRSIVAYFEGAAPLSVTAGKLLVGESPAFEINTLPVDDFPRAKPFKGVSFNVPAADLLDDLRVTLSSASTEETRYYLNGVFFEAKEGSLSLVSTDGHRLHMIRREIPAGANKMVPAIVPRRALGIIISAIEAQPEAANVKVEIGENKALFGVGCITIKTKTIDGNFPNYSRVIPTKSSSSISVGTDAVRRLARGAQIIAEGTKSALIVFDFESRQIRTHNAAEGAMSTQMLAKVKGEPPKLVGMNARYLEQICAARPNDSFTIEFEGSEDPVKFNGSRGFSAVLMPMRVQ